MGTKRTKLTAEEGFKKFFKTFPCYGTCLSKNLEREILKLAKKLAKETAKYEVQKALEIASNEAKLKNVKIPYEGVRAGGFYVVKEIDKDSILNAYKVK